MVIAMAIVVEGGDQAPRHRYVVFKLCALTDQNTVFDQLCLLVTQLVVQGDDKRADSGNSQYKWQDPQGDNFVFELHSYSCPDLVRDQQSWTLRSEATGTSASYVNPRCTE
ncbi:hypothetical protein D3C81_1967490 [compost metagenome]